MNERKAILFGLAAVACWSTVATAFKVALEHVDTYQLVFFSTLTASVCLLIAVMIRGQLSSLLPTLKETMQLTLVAGLLNPALYYVVLFHAYDRLPAQVAMSINYTWAIVLTFMSVTFLRQKPIAADFLAAFICYGGVLVIATQGDLTAFNLVEPLGLSLALLSTVIWASYWVMNVKDARESVVGLCLNFLVALPVTFLVCFAFSDFEVDVKGLLGTVYIGVIEMAVAFIFWATALKLTANTSRVSNLIFLSPFLSLVIINQVLGEAIYATTLAGLVFIVGGLFYQQLMHARIGKRSTNQAGA